MRNKEGLVDDLITSIPGEWNLMNKYHNISTLM